MNAGEIGDRAGRIFQYNIPINWAYRSQEDQNDFGIDAEIELKDSNGTAHGKESVFKVQLKGELNTTKILNGEYISYCLRVERLKYYLSFNIPVILVVVDVSTEQIFWISITDNLSFSKSIEGNNNKTIQVHIPTNNRLDKNSDESFNNLLTSVSNCWNYLSVRGLKNAVDYYQKLSTENIKDVIENVGDALYKAYHQQLQNFLAARQFNNIFETAWKMTQSEIIPAKDRFVATLYYDHAFTKQPFTHVVKEVLEQKYNICRMLIYFAKKDKLQNHRLLAFSKSRIAIFRAMNEQLFTLHTLNQNPRSDGIGQFVIFDTSNTLYRECCKHLEKIIRLFSRIVIRSQLDILCNELISLIVPIILFKKIHSSRGTDESISFLDDWFNSIFGLCLTYSCMSKELEYALDMYRLNLKTNTENRTRYKSLILQYFPDTLSQLDEIDSSRPNLEEVVDFYSVSVEEQKDYYIKTAKSIHMDPDDPECTLGSIVAMAMQNYDPTEILRNCEHLIVDYRPGGVVAEMLHLHSAGGMHLIMCLKHNYMTGTGNLLSKRFDCESEHEFMRGFKQQYCDHCPDVKKRDENWKWSLKWQIEYVAMHKKKLGKIRF